jgi:hypothetical protein
VAHLVPAPAVHPQRAPRRSPPAFDRATEERIVELAASGDLRPSRWLRAGDSWLLAGIAMILASHAHFDRARTLALAERLQPGITAPAGFGRWLRRTPVPVQRFVSLLDARLRERASTA